MLAQQASAQAWNVINIKGKMSSKNLGFIFPPVYGSKLFYAYLQVYLHVHNPKSSHPLLAKKNHIFVL